MTEDAYISSRECRTALLSLLLRLLAGIVGIELGGYGGRR